MQNIDQLSQFTCKQRWLPWSINTPQVHFSWVLHNREKKSSQMKFISQLRSLYYNKNLFQRGAIKTLISIVENWLYIITGIRSDKVVLGHLSQSPGYLGYVPLLTAKQKAEPSSLQFAEFIYMFPSHMSWLSVVRTHTCIRPNTCSRMLICSHAVTLPSTVMLHASNHKLQWLQRSWNSDILDTSAWILKAFSPFQRGATLLASHNNKDKRWEICQDCCALSCLQSQSLNPRSC